MNYRTSSGQVVSDQDPNIEEYKQGGAVPVEDTKSDVSMVSSNLGIDAVNQGQDYLNNIPAYTSEQYDKDLAAEKAAKVEKPVEEKQPEGGYSLEEMVDLVGNDFTGVQKVGDKYYPDASALQRAGISGLTEEGKTSQLESELTESNRQIENMINDFNSYNVDDDPAFQAQAKLIRDQYDKMRRQMEDTNMRRERALDTLGLRGGTTRYAGGVQAGIISEELTQANERIADINTQEQQALAGARQAYESGAYSKFAQKIDNLKTIREMKAEALENYNNKLVEANKAMAEQQKFELDVLKYEESLMTDDTKEYEYAQGQGFEGDILDYFTAKEELKAQNPNMPSSYIEWQLAGGVEGTGKSYADYLEKEKTTPSSYKEWELAGGIEGTGKTYAQFLGGTQGLPNTVINQIDKISTSFDNAPIVKNYNDVVNKKISVDAIVSRGVSGPADLALVFEFMKSLDPTSVVRESEYDSAAKSGNIFKGWAAKFNGYMNEEGGFLPEEVKSEFKGIVDSKLQAIERQYDKLKSEKARLIDQKTGKADGDSYLIDYKIDTETPLDEMQYQSEIKKMIDNGSLPEDEINNAIDYWESQGLDWGYEDVYNLYKQDFNEGSTGPNEGAVNINIPQSSRLAYVNNNPGNLRFVNQTGASQGEGGFAKFNSPEAGWKALINDIKGKQTGNTRTGLTPNSTLSELISVYAPPSENATSQYISQIASALGISPNTKLNKIDTLKLAKSIAKKESSTIIS